MNDECTKVRIPRSTNQKDFKELLTQQNNLTRRNSAKHNSTGVKNDQYS